MSPDLALLALMVTAILAPFAGALLDALLEAEEADHDDPPPRRVEFEA